MSTGAAALAPPAAAAPVLRDALELVVACVIPRTASVVSVHLRAANSAPLPGFIPGSHLVLECLGSAGRLKANAYSLTGSGTFPDEYTISVLRQEDGTGGSLSIHRLLPGDTVRTSRPRSAFAPVATAGRHLLISAGIGVTPILSHARAAAQWGREALVLSVHRQGAGAHQAELRQLAETNQHIELVELTHRADFSMRLARILREQPLNTHLYVCGPKLFMDEVLTQARTAGWPESRLHFEAFGAADLDPGTAFTVSLASSGKRVMVPSGSSLLEALEGAGLSIPNLCRQGVCGECRLGVLAGTPLHRDSYLSMAEKNQGASIMCCVSRSMNPELELDL